LLFGQHDEPLVVSHVVAFEVSQQDDPGLQAASLPGVTTGRETSFTVTIARAASTMTAKIVFLTRLLFLGWQHPSSQPQSLSFTEPSG